MSFHLSEKSLERLAGVHPDLARVVHRTIEITPIDFVVVEGLRSLSRQKYLMATGKTRTMNSRHLDGHAVDLAPLVGGVVSWDWEHFHPLIEAVRTAAKELGIAVIHGADWKSFPDGPHHELDRHVYP